MLAESQGAERQGAKAGGRGGQGNGKDGMRRHLSYLTWGLVSRGRRPINRIGIDKRPSVRAYILTIHEPIN